MQRKLIGFDWAMKRLLGSKVSVMILIFAGFIGFNYEIYI